jgi:adhesin/invasin
LKYGETAVVGPPANVAIVSGDNQSTGVNAPLPNPLVVKVTDQVGNAVSGAAVTFTAPSGTFSSNPVTTDAGGSASVTYTAGTDVGDVIITATSGTGSAQFRETVQ